MVHCTKGALFHITRILFGSPVSLPPSYGLKFVCGEPFEGVKDPLEVHPLDGHLHDGWFLDLDTGSEIKDESKYDGKKKPLVTCQKCIEVMKSHGL